MNQILDWKTMPESREKYSAYLASREWAVMKDLVRKRSGGICEHCGVAEATQTHHQTYERKYRELAGDLLHVCAPCHEFLSGLSDHDPRPRRSIYMAGKVGKNCWRHSLVKGLRHSTWRFIETLTNMDNDGIICRAVKVNEEELDYVGPFFVSCDHGCYHGKNLHGCNTIDEDYYSGHNPSSCVSGSPTRREVSNACLGAIDDADIIFAWIDTKDCFGTIAEIGFAVGKYKPVWIGFSSMRLCEELWFIASIARSVHIASSPKECLDGCHLATMPLSKRHV